LVLFLQLIVSEKNESVFNPKLALDYEYRGVRMKKIVVTIFIFGLLAAASVYDINYINESATMLLLGSALIGFAAVGRKKFSKKG